MQRLGVFVFFDRDGIVDDYICILLESLQKVIDELIIVINGNIQRYGLERLERFSARIYLRENMGFDGGAYKDTFLNYLGTEELQKWDEIVLFNDTFYGPFFSWSKIFSRLENEKVDFWGLSRHLKKVLPDGRVFEEHVQGYFIIVRKKMFMSNAWDEFWRSLNYPQTFWEAVIDFEINFTQFFSKNGFKYITWIDLNGKNEFLNNNENIYLYHPYELLKLYDFPIIKRKVFAITNFSQADLVMRYVKEVNIVDWQCIYKNLERLEKRGGLKPFSPFELEKFYLSHDDIYIYGHGTYGKEMKCYFDYRGWKIKSFVISKLDCEEENVICFDDLKLNENDGIILALGESGFGEVYPKVSKKISMAQLLLPKY